MVLVITLSPILPFENLPQSFVVASGSMEPTIKAGSVIFTKMPKLDSLEKGDIITFENPENNTQAITHRIDEISGKDPVVIKTKGDNNQNSDNWEINEDEILGKHLFTLPYLGYVSNFIRQPRGYILLVVVPAVLIIIKQIFNIKNAIENEIDRKVEQKESADLKTLIFGLCLSGLSIFSLTVGVSLALYKDTVEISNISITTEDWVLPESKIIGLYGEEELGEVTKRSDFRVKYEADDTGCGIEKVQLWYSHNQGDWESFGHKTESSGNFDFNSLDGDGFYDFQVLAVDKNENKEEKDFEKNFKNVFVDTKPPETELLDSSQEVILKSDDGFGSGVYKIHYTIDDGSEKEVFGQTADIKDELSSGKNEVVFYAEDTAGNIESENTEIINWDETLGDSDEDGGIVLNAFMPNPDGTDHAETPNGEWVELYNNSGGEKDISGLYIYDNDDSHYFEISYENIDGGDTSVEKYSSIRVYVDENLYLNNSGDKVRLYSQPIDPNDYSLGKLDTFEYGNSEEGKEWRRDPDGTGNWGIVD